ncbi:serine/threonine-protein kinase [Streptomyces chrestomyceticus]|uniref:serine/threonine-protein kinase n=1 Tax=Streptomyces chrestomyceticus TaxID=68185 RepID=UPI0033FDCB92
MRLELNEEWQLGERVGGGGFGAVYEAKSTTTGQQAAVKLVPKQPGTEREMLFTDLADVRNIVPIIDSGEHEDQWVLVMPRAEKSLRAHLQQHGSLPANEAVAVLSDIAATLADLDGQVVHRDLKPENVLLLDGHWRLADFGIARYSEAATAKQTFKLTGTSAYVAPERWKNQRATSASDIYALGILAHELLTGTTPFTGPEPADFAEQHQHHTPPPVPAAPPLLAALITECLFKAPQGRPAAGNLLERLQRIPAGALTGGLAALAAANQTAVAHQAEAARRASELATEAERRETLFEAATTTFALIADTVLTALTNVASGAHVRKDSQGAWAIQLNDAELRLSLPMETPPEIWGISKVKPPSDGAHFTITPSAPPFDVIASATLSLRVPANHHGYQGRSHCLWYADAQAKDQYQWFETAFMDSPLIQSRRPIVPFAQSPDQEARKALSPIVGTPLEPAWPFTPLTTGELDEFLDRWATWLARAASGQLTFPSQLPERSPYGSWRN